MKKTIVLAEQDKIDELEPWIEKLLTLLGFPGSLVTDESYLSDFIPMVLPEDPDDENSNNVSIWSDKLRYKELYNKMIQNLSARLGIEIKGNEYFWVIAQRLKDSESLQ